MQSSSPSLSKGVLLACAALTVMSGTMLAPALPALRDAFPGAPVRLVVTVPSLAIAIAAPLAGRLGGRTSTRRVLVASLALYAIAGLAGFVLRDFASILVSRALLGVAAGGVMTSSTTVAAASESAERARFFAQQASVMSLAGVLSVAFGGLLAAHHWRAPFVVYLAAIPVGLLAARFIAEPPRQAILPTTNTADVGPRAPIYVLTLVAMAFVFMVPLQVPFLLVNAGPRVAGLAVALTTLFAAVSALVASISRVAPAAPIVWLARSFFVMGAGYLVVGLASGHAMFVGLAIAGTGSGWIMPQVSRWLVASTPEHARSASIGVLSASVYGGQFLSPIVAELLGARSSVARAFVLAGGVLAILALVIVLVRIRAERR